MNAYLIRLAAATWLIVSGLWFIRQLLQIASRR